MADRKISDLTALTTPAVGDFLPIVDISEAAAASKNKRITIQELFRGVPLGTAAAPGIAIEGDEDTGVFSPGANQLAISTAGTERARIGDPTGRLLIGTSSAQGNSTVTIQQTAADSAPLAIRYTNTNDNQIGIDFYRSRTSSAKVENTDFIMRLDAYGYDGSTYRKGASIEAIVDAATSAGDMPCRLVFSTTADGAATPTERLRITSAGVLQVADAGNITVGTTTGTKIGTATTQKIGFFGVTPVVQQTELTDELTTITHTAPGTADFAIQNLSLVGYGFVTENEGNTVLSVIANLQARVNELETKLVALGFLADAD